MDLGFRGLGFIVSRVRVELWLARRSVSNSGVAKEVQKHGRV